MFTGNHTGIQRVALAQAGLALIAALISGGLAGVGAGLAALYGALVAPAGSAGLGWHERAAMRDPGWGQDRLV